MISLRLNMDNGLYTTSVMTRNKKNYDLSKKEYPPFHEHEGGKSCKKCLVVNAWAACLDKGEE